MTKKLFSSAICAMFLAGAAFGAPYELDTAHSSTNFKVKHLSISNVNGAFKDVKADIDVENGIPNKLDAVIKTNSVFTDNTARDSHLQQADFFDSVKYPDMKFTMTKFEKEDANEVKVIGNLTIKDVTRPVTLSYEFGGKTVDQKGKEHIGFSLEGDIKRSDFEFAKGTSNAVLGDKIKINVEIEAIAK